MGLIIKISSTLWTAKKLNCQQHIGRCFLSQFNFHLTHKAGTLMKRPMPYPDNQTIKGGGGRNDNSNITLLKLKYFRIAPCAGALTN